LSHLVPASTLPRNYPETTQKLPSILGFSLTIIYRYVFQSIWEELGSSSCICSIRICSARTPITTQKFRLGQSGILLDFSVPSTNSTCQIRHSVSRKTRYERTSRVDSNSLEHGRTHLRVQLLISMKSLYSRFNSKFIQICQKPSLSGMMEYRQDQPSRCRRVWVR
jgi:hypothetical protein